MHTVQWQGASRKQQTLEFQIWQLESESLLGTSIIDKSQDHAVQINEKAEQVVTQFNHGFLHVGLELTSVMDLSWVKHPHISHWDLHVPINVPGCYRQVEEEDKPVHGDQHQHCGETLAHHLWNYPFV